MTTVAQSALRSLPALAADNDQLRDDVAALKAEIAARDVIIEDLRTRLLGRMNDLAELRGHLRAILDFCDDV